jgi:hypothetical protein
MDRLETFKNDYLAILTPETEDAPQYEELNKPAPSKKAYCFTINNPTEAHIDALIKIETKYKKSTKEGSLLIWELEVGWGRKEHTNEDGTKHKGKHTLHVQGYIQLTSCQPAKYVKTVLKCETAMVFISKGSWQANQHYCSKDRNHPDFAHLYKAPRTWGEVVAHPHPEGCQGKRTDIEALQEDIKAGVKLENLKDTHFNLFLRYKAGIEGLMSLAPKIEKPKLKVIWHWGTPGSGKTYDAKMKLGIDQTYIKTLKTNFWWDGYDPSVHKAVVMDEVDKSDKCYCLANMLPLMDENNVIVQVKGSSRVFIPEYLYITSTQSPRDLYPKEEDYQQIIRRCDEVIEYKKKRITFCKQTLFKEVSDSEEEEGKK